MLKTQALGASLSAQKIVIPTFEIVSPRSCI